jgi:hypothetical protein
MQKFSIPICALGHPVDAEELSAQSCFQISQALLKSREEKKQVHRKPILQEKKQLKVFGREIFWHLKRSGCYFLMPQKSS